jgi:hypothetical protein
VSGRPPSPDSMAGRLLVIVRGLGNDKYGAPLSIKTSELARRASIPNNQVQCNMAGAVARGDVVVCKVTPAGGRPYNEYRVGPGVPPPALTSLNVRKSGIAQATHRGATNPEAPTLRKPQPAVGTTPAAGDQGPPPVAPAVTAAKATPEPKAGVRLKEEPTTPKASAGDATYLGALDISINHEGTLIIGTVESVIELAPEHTRRLGNFLLGSQGVWNPF